METNFVDYNMWITVFNLFLKIWREELNWTADGNLLKSELLL